MYAAAYYHLVWATKNRVPLIVPEFEVLVWEKLRRSCEEMKAWGYEVNGMPDHVHIACSIPPSIAISQFIQKLKGSSAHFVNHLDEAAPDAGGLCLYWQHGYGLHTFTKRDLPRVVDYIRRQKQRHEQNRLWPHLEATHDYALQNALQEASEA